MCFENCRAKFNEEGNQVLKKGGEQGSYGESSAALPSGQLNRLATAWRGRA